MSAVRPVWTALRLMAAYVAYLVCFMVAYGLVVRGTPPSPGVEPISPGLAILLVSGLNTVVMSWLILRSRLAGMEPRRRHGPAVLWRPDVHAAGGVADLPGQSGLREPPARGGHSAPVPGRPAACRPVDPPGHSHPRTMAARFLVLRPRKTARAPGRPGRGSCRSPRWPTSPSISPSAITSHGGARRSPRTTRAPTPARSGRRSGTSCATRRGCPPPRRSGAFSGRPSPSLVMRITRGSRLEKALATGVLFAVVMTSGLLLPNPYMPFEVRMVHLVETAPSNFLFGALLVWLLGQSHDRALTGPPGSPSLSLRERSRAKGPGGESGLAASKGSVPGGAHARARNSGPPSWTKRAAATTSCAARSTACWPRTRRPAASSRVRSGSTPTAPKRPAGPTPARNGSGPTRSSTRSRTAAWARSTGPCATTTRSARSSR